MAVLSSPPKMQFFDITGAPLVGGKLYTYIAGTTTPLATYADSLSSTTNSNPVILNARGEANVWLGANTYKFKLTDSSNVEIWTVDNISAPTSALSPVLSGNVVINSDSSGSALTITQLGTGPALRVQDSTDPDVTPFIIDSNGNVGVGTTAPSTKLTLADGVFRLASSGGVAYTDISSDAATSYFSAVGDRNLGLYTNGVLRFNINALNASISVPLVLDTDPFTSNMAATKNYVDTIATRAAPPGIIAPFAGTAAPNFWLFCDGSAVSRTIYAALFAAIGTTWGAGDGVTTFNVPDLRGAFLRGAGLGLNPSLRNVGSYEADGNKSHTHTATDSGHTHNLPAWPSGGGSTAITYNTSGTTASDSGIPTITGNANITVASNGNTEATVKNYAVLYIIKT